jgi:hypothetical protein
MNLKNKNVFLLIIILSVFSAKNSWAQYPGMGAVRAGMNAQFMNQQMQMNLQMLNMRGAIASAQENDFEVTMLDGTKKEVTSAMYTDTVTKKHFIVYIDKQYKRADTNRYKKIYPSQTINLVCVLAVKDIDNGVPGHYETGMPTDSCWMFKVISGQINAYAYAVKNENISIDPSTLVGLQLNNGAIQKFSPENLQTLIGQNAEALKYFDKKKYIKAIEQYNKDIIKASKK